MDASGCTRVASVVRSPLGHDAGGTLGALLNATGFGDATAYEGRWPSEARARRFIHCKAKMPAARPRPKAIEEKARRV